MVELGCCRVRLKLSRIGIMVGVPGGCGWDAWRSRMDFLGFAFGAPGGR